MKVTTPTRILSRRDFRLLLRHSRSPCISIFITTHRTGREQKQDPIRLRNLLHQAHQELLNQGITTSEAASVVDPIEDLLIDELFWQHQCDGLAVFRSPEVFRNFRLPRRFQQQLVIGDRFHVRPLLPLLHTGGRFYVLALSQDSARLFEATRDSIHELGLPPIARSEIDDDQTSLQFHSQRREARPTSDEAIYHGHGGSEDRTKVDALNFFYRVNDAVTTILAGDEAPLVLACVGYLAPLYDSANSYRCLIHAKVPGNPNRWTEAELRDQAWRLVEPHVRQQERASLDAVQQAAGKGQVLTDVRDTVLAAHRGRVETLLLESGEQQWGHLDPRRDTVQVTHDETGDVELLNYAAAETLNHGGDVFVVDKIPGVQSPIAAVARY